MLAADQGWLCRREGPCGDSHVCHGRGANLRAEGHWPEELISGHVVSHMSAGFWSRIVLAFWVL
jgi:hypothetical protein